MSFFARDKKLKLKSWRKAASQRRIVCLLVWVLKALPLRVQRIATRGRDKSSLVDCSRSHGNIFLVRLPSKNQKDSESLAKVEQPCSTSGRTEVAAKNEDIDLGNGLKSLERNRSNSQVCALRNDRKQDCSTSGQMEAVALGRTSSKQRVELLEYKNLIENWGPPKRQDVCLYPDGPDWLCEGSSHAEKRPRCANDSLSCSRESALWPRAEYLHDVGVHALPFTIPF